MNIKRHAITALLVLTGAPVCAADAVFTAADLVGKWVVGEQPDCGKSAALYVVFHANGTHEFGRGDTPGAVGFWKVGDNAITLHQLVAPDESDASNVFYRGRYSYSYLSAEVLDIRQDAFDVITGATGDTVRRTLTRCD